MDNPDEIFLNEREVANLARRSLSTLRNDRSKGRGFPYIKLGRSVLYQKEDIIDFLKARKIQTEDTA